MAKMLMDQHSPETDTWHRHLGFVNPTFHETPWDVSLTNHPSRMQHDVDFEPRSCFLRMSFEDLDGKTRGKSDISNHVSEHGGNIVVVGPYFWESFRNGGGVSSLKFKTLALKMIETWFGRLLSSIHAFSCRDHKSTYFSITINTLS